MAALRMDEGVAGAGHRRIRRFRRWAVAAGVVAAAAGLGIAWLALAPWDRERALALALCRQNKFDAAEPLLLGCLGRDPHDAPVVRALVLGYLRERPHQDVAPYLDRWCAVQPDQVDPYLVRCEWAFRRQDWNQALVDAERVLAFRPNDLERMMVVVTSLRRENRLAESAAAAQRFLERRPGDPLLLYLLAEAYHWQGKDAEAGAVLDPLLPRLPPGMVVPLVLRGTLYVKADQPEKALPLLESALRQDPRDDRAWYQLSLALARLGRREEAEREMARLVRKVTEDRRRLDQGTVPDRSEAHGGGKQ
jgi:predicted Zn-dependent protease